ncbi:hypothetical protein CCUS01_15133 [Colletotrichum cuscutae]|uniref:Uncharacterized protein n=1 Tax=Colletotrichum cuscutae TaxID=1209917 RepID=A0AAI9Y7G6_9PEZI|nr:hypothetical protein CCUS01_15133 [Colletotrichum cuscutae]
MAMRVERAVLAEDDLAYLLWGKLGDGGPSPAGVRYSRYMDSGTGSRTFFAPRTYSLSQVPHPGKSAMLLPPRRPQHRQWQAPSTTAPRCTKHLDRRRTHIDTVLRP